MAVLSYKCPGWEAILKHHLVDFEMIQAQVLGCTHLAIFQKRIRLESVSNIESCKIATGFGNMLANKGAVAIQFQFRGIWFRIINAHLNAGEGESNRFARDKQLERIHSQVKFAKKNLVDCCFFLGDFNYRIQSDKSREKIMEMIEKSALHELLESDELLANELKGFKEAKIHFKPTYKYEDVRDRDVYSEKRIPAWTDRILYQQPKSMGLTGWLWRMKGQHYQQGIECLSYDSVPIVRDSDHRPVYARYKVCL
jgi:hypothetical protein